MNSFLKIPTVIKTNFRDKHPAVRSGMVRKSTQCIGFQLFHFRASYSLKCYFKKNSSSLQRGKDQFLEHTPLSSSC